MADTALLQVAEQATSDFKQIPIMYVSLSLISTEFVGRYLIRVISDVKDARHEDPAIRRRLANEIRDACVNVGFFYGMSYSHIKA